SRTCETSFALFSARPGDAALTHASAIPNAPVPLSIILGGGLITGLGIDTEEIAQRFRASRTPHGRGLVVPLDSGSSGGVRLADLLRAIEFYRATPHMGITQPQLQAVRYAARY
ncbi:MAG: DUF6177 family protein, partial [Bifidobacteriaceae bacterium]|nr:DUF6177 family protein [Bifidobacteriaceae bacterium]